MKDTTLDILRTLVKQSKHITFLGGAGVSTGSGILDFRSPTGLYNIQSKYGVSYEEMLSHTYFYNHTDIFYDFYWSTMVCKSAKPNKAHIALANYEKTGHRISIITQNIDGLHQDAGSKEVYEVHGSVRRYKCTSCDREFNLDQIESSGIPQCPICKKLLKPDVVLYEEPLDDYIINQALGALVTSDLLIIGGTSLQVYPVAAFPSYYKGKYMIIINKEPTPLDSQADYVIREDIGEVLEAILK